MPASWIEWTPDLSVGVTDFDNDHKKLIDILNTLFAASFACVGDQMLGDTLKELREYTRFHFNREIDFLAQKGYPSVEPHRFQHDKLISELEKLEIRVRQEAEGENGLSNDVVKFLRGWLIGHIREHDMGYAAYLRDISKTGGKI